MSVDVETLFKRALLDDGPYENVLREQIATYREHIKYDQEQIRRLTQELRETLPNADATQRADNPAVKPNPIGDKTE